MGSEHHLPKWFSKSLLPAYYTLFLTPTNLFHKVSRGHHLGASWIESSTLSRNGAWVLQLLHLSNYQEFNLLSSPHPLPRVALHQEKTFQLPSTVPQNMHTAGSTLKA